jgi:D-galactarolactone cycloisomerase
MGLEGSVTWAAGASVDGGPLRSRVQAYATGFYRKRGGDAVSYLIDEAQQRADAGFAAIKLKLGFGIDEDIKLCRSLTTI